MLKFKRNFRRLNVNIRIYHDARSSEWRIIVEGRNSTVFAKREHSVMNNNRKMAQNAAIATALSKKVTSAKLLLNRTKSFSNESHDKLDF